MADEAAAALDATDKDVSIGGAGSAGRHAHRPGISVADEHIAYQAGLRLGQGSHYGAPADPADPWQSIGRRGEVAQPIS